MCVYVHAYIYACTCVKIIYRFIHVCVFIHVYAHTHTHTYTDKFVICNLKKILLRIFETAPEHSVSTTISPKANEGATQRPETRYHSGIIKKKRRVLPHFCQGKPYQPTFLPTSPKGPGSGNPCVGRVPLWEAAEGPHSVQRLLVPSVAVRLGERPGQGAQWQPTDPRTWQNSQQHGQTCGPRACGQHNDKPGNT